MKIIEIPKFFAIAHACWEPAPPKHAKTCCEVSNPFPCVKARIGRHIDSFATAINPKATSSIESFPFNWELL